MEQVLRALRGSVVRLHALCRGLDDVQLEAPSYCTEWSIADVLGHVGSTAAIMHRQLDDALAGRATPEGFVPAVWEEWDAKSPRVKVDDALVVDESLLEAFESVGETERAAMSYPMGPLTLSFEQAVAMRVNEHALHSWDVEVTFDDGAHLPDDAAAVVVDNLVLIVRFTARPPGQARDVAVRTVHPARDFVISLSPEGADLLAGESGHEPDIELPAESLCRLVYGRLDEDHCPPVGPTGVEALDLLRLVFPGP